ncbi:MAG TPA: hypothetical protein VJ723_14570, partial [Candidatus Angelobacter sp.]|nr:hypothetical protein [Candidatus Angelobacter sp.]
MQNNGNQDETRRHGIPPEESGVALLVFLALGLASAALYIANKRYHIRPEQMVESILYLTCLAGAVWVTIHYLWTYKKKQEQTWPRIPAYIPSHKDESHLENAFRQNA